MVATRTVPKVIVQTASNLEASNTGWETQRWLTCLEWSDGAGSVVGYAKLSQFYGLMARLLGPNAVEDLGISPDTDRSTPGSLVGKLVRVCLESSGGTIVEEFPHVTAATGFPRLVYEPAYFTPVWHGIIRDLSFSVDGDPDSPGGLAEFTAAGLASALDQVFVDRGYVLSASGSVITVNTCPSFNSICTYVTGDRSVSQVSVNSGLSYVHDLSSPGGTGSIWTASTMLTLILTAHARPSYGGSPTGWTWSVSDPTGALSYVQATVDLSGLSVLEAINELISQRRGLTWNVSVSGSTATINVLTTVATSVSIVPANPQTTTLSIADQPWLTELQVRQDGSAAYDIISIIGKQPWASISLDYSSSGGGSLGKGWTTSQESSWVNDPSAPIVDGVWRRFLADNNWSGAQYGSGGNGLRNSLTVATGSITGAGGYNGARAFNASVATVPATMIRSERLTPIPKVIAGGASDERFAPKQGPMLFYYNGSSWSSETEFSITVEEYPLAVVIDDHQDGKLLRSLLSVTGARFVVTIGVREAEPLIVSWIRDQALWPSSLPRVKAIEVDAVQEVVTPGTVTGESSGSLTTTSTGVMRDDVLRMTHALEHARAAWADPVYSVTWQDRGRCLTARTAAAYAPGTLITSIIDGAGSTTVNATVLRRTCSWQGDAWATSFQAERLPPTFVSL